MELKMLEDWLDNPELEDGFQGIAKVEETCSIGKNWRKLGMQLVQLELEEDNLSEEIVENNSVRSLQCWNLQH
jgi:hypothetical protein